MALRAGGRVKKLFSIFSNPKLPSIDDYYEPWTYDYKELFNAPEGPDQPVAKPISLVTGEYIDIESGPNWDDDLGGSPVYAARQPQWDAACVAAMGMPARLSDVPGALPRPTVPAAA